MVKTSTYPADVIKESNRHLFSNELQEAFEALKGVNKTQVFFPEKYYPSMFSVLEEDIIEMNRADAERPIKTVVAEIVASLPEFIPSDKVLEVAAFTVKKWQELSQSVELEAA